MKNTQLHKTNIMHPVGFTPKSKRKHYKPKLHDLVYLILCTLIIIGFADNVDRFVKSAITPKIVAAQVRLTNAKKALFNESLLVPNAFVSPLAVTAKAAEVKNPFNPKSPKGIAWELVKSEFGIEHWGSYEELITSESGWNPYAKNPNGGACGIPQALPCSKMNCEQWDYECQIKWSISYIKDRYGNPIAAWNFWQTLHEVNGEWVHYY